MVDGFLRKVKDAIVGGEEQYDEDANEQYGDVRPASEDPYGDPGDYEQAGYGQDYGQFGDVRPASEDPYGDPADQENTY